MRVLVLTGAGVSAESGIPTFRGKDGYWRNLDPTKLATPEAFARDPQLVWDWYRERRKRIRNARPNAAHEAIARLAQRTDEFLLVTQNVDDLHARAGIPAQKMVQIHGDIFVTRCSRCDFSDAGRGGSPEPPGACVVQPTNGRSRSIAATSKKMPIFHGVQTATRSSGQGWCGSVNNCRRTNWNELKIFSMAELAMS